MSFEQAFAQTVGHEGGYVNDPDDRGDETKFGISKAAYPQLDIAALTLDQAREIYRRDYWTPCGCDEWPPEVAAAVFDLAVNAGRSQGIKALQLAVREVADGVIGPRTRAAVAATDPVRAAVRVHAAGLEYRTNAPTWPQHGKGWTRRVVRNLLEL